MTIWEWKWEGRVGGKKRAEVRQCPSEEVGVLRHLSRKGYNISCDSRRMDWQDPVEKSVSA